MAALTAWKFDTVEGAGQALKKLEDLSRQQLVTIEDSAIVYWETGKNKPKTHQAHSLTGAGALGGAFWGMLFGLIFFMPFFGLAVGAAVGALAVWVFNRVVTEEEEHIHEALREAHEAAPDQVTGNDEG